MNLQIHEGDIEGAVRLLQNIPEMQDTPGVDVIRTKLQHVPHLILTAVSEGQVVGCKIGYEREGRFYSWLGAVMPDTRKEGVAAALADYQEQWAKSHGYQVIWMKTRNCFPSMMLMAVRRGFRIVSVDPREDLLQNRIVLEKTL